jgi:hypothetical protein
MWGNVHPMLSAFSCVIDIFRCESMSNLMENLLPDGALPRMPSPRDRPIRCVAVSQIAVAVWTIRRVHHYALLASLFIRRCSAQCRKPSCGSPPVKSCGIGRNENRSQRMAGLI